MLEELLMAETLVVSVRMWLASLMVWLRGGMLAHL